MEEHPAPRLMILVVAYNAATTIESVLSRIPIAKLPPGTEVVVIDDSSRDETFEKALAHTEALRGLRVTVLANPVNQGYGGNQKIGYLYAIEQGFSVVALLHGDGQYAPEMLPELVAPVLSGEADACFGSRMLEPRAALKNGMPLYKYVGNKILTVFQNRVLRMGLSEFHSGYRVYSVEALKQLPFRYNTNDFHFDTEIIIQFARKGLTIKELPIPTYYGDEICYVNGWAYAWDVCTTTLASRLHEMGLLYQPRFDVHEGQPQYDLKLGYPSSHTLALARIPDDSSVLDLACGDGGVAGELKRHGCRVTGIDRERAYAGPFEAFHLHDLDAPDLPAELGAYDYILALDCLEHLQSPERLLNRLRERCYNGNTTIIATTPNVAFFMVRLALLLGQFNYGKAGILDLTHHRLFTFRSFRRLLEQEGCLVTSMRGIPAPFPKALGPGLAGRFLLGVNRVLVALWPRMFAYQIYAEARFVPPLERLLGRTVRSSAERRREAAAPAEIS